MSGVPDFPRRERAFRLWAQYRNMSKVSKELKIPTQTLLSWKKSEQWEDKLAQLKDKLRGQYDVLKKAEDSFILEKDLAKIKLIEVLEEQVSKAITENRVIIDKWSDIIKTLEFTTKERRLLMGEPTEREINTIEVQGMSEEDLDSHIGDLKKFIDGSSDGSGTG